MARIYLIAAPGNTGEGEALAAWLKRRGFVVRTDFGRFQFPPLRDGEVLVVLWSMKAMFSVKQLFLVNRAIDAWEEGRLVLAKLDRGLNPRGLGDVEMIDLAFEPAREHRYIEVANAVRAIAAPPELPQGSVPAPSGPVPRASESQPGAAPDLGILGARRRSADREVSAADDGAQDDGLDEAVDVDLPPQLFVSYASANKETVWPIVERVEGLGIDVWLDRDDIRVGQNWAGSIVRAIKAVERVCLMCSAEAFQSDHVRREIYLADKYKKALVPVRLDGAEMPEDFEYFLIDKQWLDAGVLAGPEGDGLLRQVFGGAGSG